MMCTEQRIVMWEGGMKESPGNYFASLLWFILHLFSIYRRLCLPEWWLSPQRFMYYFCQWCSTAVSTASLQCVCCSRFLFFLNMYFKNRLLILNLRSNTCTPFNTQIVLFIPISKCSIMSLGCYLESCVNAQKNFEYARRYAPRSSLC